MESNLSVNSEPFVTDETPVSGSVPDTVPGPSVLVVDDEALISLEIAGLLHDAGFSIAGPATSIDDALQLLDQNDCKLAVVDLQLDGVVAVELLDALRRRAIPYVVVSGLHPTQLPSCVMLPEVVSKPFQGDLLVSRCRQIAGLA